MKTVNFLFFLFFYSLNHAQYSININAQVIDYNSKQPISFVEIGLNKNKIKTISDYKGYFVLNFDDDVVLATDSIIFSIDKYIIKKVEVSQFYKLLKNSNKIYLKVIDTLLLKPLNQKKLNKNNKNIIYGVIKSDTIPLQNATLSLKNSMSEVQTNANGEYNISADLEDVLIVEYLGMKTKEVLITQNEMNVELEPEGELLQEVLVIGEKNKSELIDLGKGVKKNFDAIGTSVNIITSKDISPHYSDLGDVLRGKFASLSHSRESSINNVQGKIFDIDGMIYSYPDPIPDVHPQNIESIVILTSLAATTKYGSLGRGGVIVIRTKTVSGAETEAKKPSALATGNDYTEQVQPINALNIEPDYLQILQNTKTVDEAKQTYKTLKQSKDNQSVAFYLDAAEYFLKWDKQYAMEIFTYVEELAKDNAKALKTIAFNYESLHLYEKARLVYQRITLLRPTEAQSYRDLALIYNTTGYYNEAMRLYKQMLSNSIEGVDFSGLQQPITDELMHLLAKHRSKVDYTDIPADVLATKFKQDLRIVFEWNDPNAEFELQFVNPQKKFFKWSHTKFDNRERMLDEIKKGYTTEAYIIDDAEAGEWIINLESLNEKPDINPNYLKYTVYKNYGLPNETKTVKVIQLQNIKQKVTLDKILYQ